MRRALLAIAVLGACATDESPAPREHLEGAARVDLESVEVLREDDHDLCELAASLPGDDACSLVCDPEAFAARLVDDGMAGGRCYQMRCDLGSLIVSVGVCLL